MTKNRLLFARRGRGLHATPSSFDASLKYEAFFTWDEVDHPTKLIGTLSVLIYSSCVKRPFSRKYLDWFNFVILLLGLKSTGNSHTIAATS